MKNMKIVKLLVIAIITVGIIGITSKSCSAVTEKYEKNAKSATTVTSNTNYDISSKDDAQNLINTILEMYSDSGLTKTTVSEIISAYQAVSAKYNNTEIIEMIENGKVTLEKEKINVGNLDSAISLLTDFNAEKINSIISKVNIDEALSQMGNGSTLLQVIEKAIADMSTSDKVSIALTFIEGTKTISVALTVSIILLIYKILIRCVILKKAGESAWKSIVPIYNNITMFRMCGMSAKWMFLLLVPILGWAILGIVNVACRFMLAASFNKSVGFAFGLWLMWPIFGGILAFDKKAKYVGILEDDDEYEAVEVEKSVRKSTKH